MSKRPIFSLDDFKKWMEDQDDEKLRMETEQEVGSEVQSKINLKKLMNRIEAEEGNEEELSKEFIDDGGTVLESIDNKFLIEVSSGSFYLHRKYVEAKDC